ncbi:MAG: arsenic efflux protein [Lachnospiraceae bacterium]|nr:arsenic efflux protein [Lachnospiraceae bacterium]
MFEIIEHTLLDAVSLVPFLFLTYLVMEWLEHKAGKKAQKFMEKSGQYGPVWGSVLGAIPQCGFSAAAANLYAGRVITMGTLVAIYLSTSDEMIPIMISEAVDPVTIVKIVALKIVIGMAAGLLLDFMLPDKHDEHNHIHEMCEHEHCHCGEGKGIVRSAITHTLKITVFILLITFILNLILHNGGEDVIADFLMNKPVIGPLVAGIVGLIPNCVSSVVITRLYIEGAMSFGALMSGLLVNAGVGMLVLLRSNADRKEALKIIGIACGIGMVAGIIIDFMQVAF